MLDGGAGVGTENRLAVNQTYAGPAIAVHYLRKMGETLLARQTLEDRFLRKHAQGGQAMTVARLRAWTDDHRLGLTRDVQNLVILVFAAQTDRAFFRSGRVQSVARLAAGRVELKTEVLPESGEWEVAVRRAAAIFGVTVAPLLSRQNVAKVASANWRASGVTSRQLVIGLQRAAEPERLGGPQGFERDRNAPPDWRLSSRCSLRKGAVW